MDSVPAKLVGPDGAIRGPAGDGKAAWVARDDLAAVTATVVLEEGHEGKTYEVTGREALSLAECAEVMTRVVGRPFSFYDETVSEMTTSLPGSSHQTTTGSPPRDAKDAALESTCSYSG